MFPDAAFAENRRVPDYRELRAMCRKTTIAVANKVISCGKDAQKESIQNGNMIRHPLKTTKT